MSLTQEGGADMVTTTMTIHGTRLSAEAVRSCRLVSAHACIWKRPSVITLTGFPTTDNSTGVSAVERRHQ